MYVKALAILLLCVAVFFFGRSTGVDAERSKRTESAEKTITKRTEAEKVIVQDRIVYRDRIQKIREVVHQCNIPADLIGLLRESRVFTGG